jgi:predicted ester cyclase
MCADQLESRLFLDRRDWLHDVKWLLHGVDYINHNPFVEDGREAKRAFWSSFFTAFPDIETTMDDLVVAGDRVVGRFTYRGTHAGLFYGVPASGNSIEMRSIDIWRTENGEFVEHWDELNLLDLFQQIGMIPPFELADAQRGETPSEARLLQQR